jgi:hypothetical protein
MSILGTLHLLRSAECVDLMGVKRKLTLSRISNLKKGFQQLIDSKWAKQTGDSCASDKENLPVRDFLQLFDHFSSYIISDQFYTYTIYSLVVGFKLMQYLVP